MSFIAVEVDDDHSGVDSNHSHDYTSTSSTKTDEPASTTQTEFDSESEISIGEYFERRARVPPVQIEDDKLSKNNGSMKEVAMASPIFPPPPLPLPPPRDATQAMTEERCPLDNSSLVCDRNLNDENPSFIHDEDLNDDPQTQFEDDKPSKNNGSVKEVRFSLDKPSFFPEKEEDATVVYYKDSTPVMPWPTPRKDKAETNFIRRKSPRRRCLWIVIAILVILLVVITALFIWRMSCCKNEDVTIPSTTTATPTTAPSPVGCTYRPRPIKFGTLPTSIQKELEDFQAFIKEQIAKKQAVAVSANVVYRDKVIWEGGFGTMNLAEQPARTPTSKTLYPSASVSKVLTALVLFKLKNEERIRLDDPVIQYETRFSVRNPFDNNKITLRQLASQQSGLPREGPCYPATATNLCPYDYETMLNRLKNVSLVRKPGTLPPSYSNLAYAVLGQIVAKKFGPSGSTFSQWMKDELLSKIGMTNSSFSVTEKQKVDVPIGYLDVTSSYPIQEWGWLQPAGGLFTSVHDLAKLQIELMSDKASTRILSDLSLEEFFKPDYIFPDGKSMIGTPWEIKFSKGYLLREQQGYAYGYSSYVVMVPEMRLGLNLLCTGCRTSVQVQSRFERILAVFHDELTRASVKNFSMPPDSKTFTGRYNTSIPDFKTVEVKDAASHLTLAINGFDLFFLNYTAPLTFRIVVNPALDCLNSYTQGARNAAVIFDEPLTPGGLSRGFTTYIAEPNGRSYFPRN